MPQPHSWLSCQVPGVFYCSITPIPTARYLENVPSIVPLLEKEYRNAARRLEDTQDELTDLHPDKCAKTCLHCACEGTACQKGLMCSGGSCKVVGHGSMHTPACGQPNPSALAHAGPAILHSQTHGLHTPWTTCSALSASLQACTHRMLNLSTCAG